MLVKNNCLSYNLSMIISYIIIVIYFIDFMKDFHDKTKINKILLSILLVLITHVLIGFFCKNKFILSSALFSVFLSICLILILIDTQS